MNSIIFQLINVPRVEYIRRNIQRLDNLLDECFFPLSYKMFIKCFNNVVYGDILYDKDVEVNTDHIAHAIQSIFTCDRIIINDLIRPISN
jgi:hypothetical protein